MRDIKSILEGIVSQGKTVGSGGSSFRDRSSSNDKSGLNIGANRVHDRERAAKEASADRAEKREDEVKKRNREAKQRQKETTKMSKEETVTEAKHVFHVHLHADDTRLGKMVDDKTVEPIGAKPKGTKIKLTVPAHDTRTARDKATRYAAKNFGVDAVKSIEYKGLHEDTVVEANIGPNVDTETIRGIHQRAHASITNPNNKKLTYSHPGFADQIDNELKARKELAKRGIKVERPKHRAVIEHNLEEAIKGWKNAASDIRKFRSAVSDAKKSAMLVSLKKDGNESGMHDAKSYHASEEEARKKHETITKLNPNRKIRHNLYVDGKKVDTLGEETNTEKREEIENVARMDGAKPTSEKSTLSKTGQIKTKIVEEKPTMSVPNFGLPKSLIDSVRQIVEKKDEDEKDPKKMTGGKTVVDTDPETDDKQNDDDAAAKGKKKAVKEETKSHTVPKTDKEKKLAALASPKDKITHKDVLVGRGVVKEEEVEDLEEVSKDTLQRYMHSAKSERMDPTKGGQRKAGMDLALKKSIGSKDVKVKAAGMSKKEMGEEVEFSAEEIERIEAIAAELAEAKPTVTSAPTRGANQDQSGFNTKNSTADYTISDEKKLRKEEVEELDELKRSTLASYVKKAATSSGSPRDLEHLGQITKTHPDARDKILNKMQNRQTGIVKAADRLAKEEVDIDEAIKIGSKVKVHAPGKDYHGVIGNVGEIDHGLHKKSEKKYTVDYNNRSNSVTLPKSQIKLHKEEVDLDETVLHDRYIRSHGKKAGGSGDWAFTTKSSGTPEKHEMAWTKGSLGDAAKDAKKKLNAKHVYVMENSIIEVELEEGRGRPRKNPLPAGQAADVDDTNKHPMQQIEKISHSIEGREPHFEHKDGSKTKVGRHLARHMMVTHNSMKTTQEKDDFANKLHANRDSMRSAMSKHF
jgi:hypothetical protein